MFKVGMTGTKLGMRREQLDAFDQLLGRFAPQFHHNREFHHGDCVGADDMGANLAYKWQFYIVSHPPISDRYRAFNDLFDREEPKLEYLERDRKIVEVSDVLLAAPHTPYEIIRSGTWTTVRYAREKKIPIYIVLPSGTVQIENFPQ